MKRKKFNFSGDELALDYLSKAELLFAAACIEDFI
jgi:hypothetical protein